MFSCSNKTLYLLDRSGIIIDLENEINKSAEYIVNRKSFFIQYKELKRLPFYGHYVRIQTDFYLKCADDLEYNYEELEEKLLNPEFCDFLARNIVGSKKQKHNKDLYFSCLSGKRFGKNYFIIYWR